MGFIVFGIAFFGLAYLLLAAGEAFGLIKEGEQVQNGSENFTRKSR